MPDVAAKAVMKGQKKPSRGVGRRIGFFAAVSFTLVGVIASFFYCQPKTVALTQQPMDSRKSRQVPGWEDRVGGADFGVSSEPEPGRIYHCAQGEVRPSGLFSRHVDWEGIEAYVNASGYRPKLIMHYITFDPLGFRLLKSTLMEIASQPFDYVPQVGLDFYSYIPGFDILNPRDITQKIVEGAYDDRIRELAGVFISMERPVFLRPGYEFGGRGQGRHADKRYWVGAWKRIHDVLKAEGASRVVFVWHTLDATDYMTFYPGDDYVDWWGVSVFVNDADNDPFLNEFIRAAAEHRKPVMVAEATPRYVGAGAGERSWNRWYKPVFDLMFAYPHIKAFCYINASWENYPDRTFLYDARIQSNKFVAERFRSMMSDSRFIHQR